MFGLFGVGQYTAVASNISRALTGVNINASAGLVSTSEFFGFGAGAVGGSTVYTVTNLNDSGAGSLREGLSVSGRKIEFSVGGTINLTSQLNVITSTTIRGFTAPSPGITLINTTGNGFVVTGNNNGPTTTGSDIIIQGVRIRNCGGDGIQVAYNAHDVVIDHCSSCNNEDGDFDFTNGAYNITLSWCVMNNRDGFSPGCSLLSYNTGRVSYHHNIFFDGQDRNPILTHTYDYSEAGPSGPNHGDPMADVRHNIVRKYSIGTYIMRGVNAGNANANVVSNLYESNGLSSPGNTVVRARFSGASTRADGYIAGNVSIHNCSGTTYLYDTDPPVTRVTCNDQSNIAEVSAPAIPGPSHTDKQGRIDEWTKVKNEAGVVLFYTDDAQDSEARTAINLPTLSTFTQPWNDG